MTVCYGVAYRCDLPANVGKANVGFNVYIRKDLHVLSAQGSCDLVDILKVESVGCLLGCLDEF